MATGSSQVIFLKVLDANLGLINTGSVDDKGNGLDDLEGLVFMNAPVQLP
jgi:hypothetical protein